MWKKVNTFAIMVVLMIAVPEAVGHSLFERPHPAWSSPDAAISLVEKIGKDPQDNVNCSLVLRSDPSGAQIERASGLEGKYGDYNCA